jgi:hypothetical protein
MINFPKLNSATLWWAGLLALLAWALAGTLDGATLVETLGGPLVGAAWMSGPPKSFHLRPPRAGGEGDRAAGNGQEDLREPDLSVKGGA